jgi:MoaA/NifB/PqqE/SkfB family radical SAM enzyme
MKKRLYANHKASLNQVQVKAYLAGKNVFPRTVELDLTTRCTRACPTCPCAGSVQPSRVLAPAFVDRFLGVLGGETRGIILSGGEPTSSPHFIEILRIARRRRFTEVAVITNGTELGRPAIQDAFGAREE